MDRDMIKTSVMDWCAGEIRDKVDYDAARVADNILNRRTDPEFVRKITLTISFKPDADRGTVAVSAVSKVTLAPTEPSVTCLYFGADDNGEPQLMEIGDQMPGQTELDG